ncbi:aromatic amino acid ammonia-lyase [Plantactinospora sp. WMMB334]|uniref:aromatic amino acid ammonia-lyase n=1 Tax=Plantactinospora sp. WMMB334 TaxID=3404119 RepID=UPI003B93269B
MSGVLAGGDLHGAVPGGAEGLGTRPGSGPPDDGGRADQVTPLLRATGWTARTDLDEAERGRLHRGRERLARLVASRPVYGVSRGYGPLVRYGAEPDPFRQADGLLAHLCVGQGPPLPPEVARTMVWLRLQSMRLGHSGVDVAVWSALAAQWNAGITPRVPQDGSLSASGDLVPLAHAARAAAGDGEVWNGFGATAGAPVPAADALRRQGLEPVRWDARSALAFVNGTSASLAMALHNHDRIRALAEASAAVTGRLVTLLGAATEAYAERLALVRGHPGHRLASEWIRSAAGDVVADPARPLQEPYSLRCAPQVLGAVLDQVRLQAEVLATEARGCTDNPVLVGDAVLHGGNFHAAPVALAVEQQAVCVHQVAYLAERQLALVVDPERNGGRPPFLTPRPGRGSGLAGVQMAATSHLAAIRQAGYPASMTPLPANLDNQDHVPMALNGANAVRGMLDRAWWIMGSLFVAAHQLSLLGPAGSRRPEPAAPWEWFEQNVPGLLRDRPLAAEVAAAAEVVERRFGWPSAVPADVTLEGTDGDRTR